jgi:hypothetical protein
MAVQPREIGRYITRNGTVPFGEWFDNLRNAEGQIGSSIVLLLCGGDKSTQSQDISQAIEYWTEYRSRENAN